MKCPFCGHKEDKVVDSRATQDYSSVRRRRECLKCGRRFTTYEYVEKIPLMVIKRDGRREPFNREKILQGLLKACQKRPVSIKSLEVLTENVEQEIQKKFDREVESTYIGELVVDRLSRLDDVAYVRFASVYRQFRDVNEFMQELKEILDRKRR